MGTQEKKRKARLPNYPENIIFPWFVLNFTSLLEGLPNKSLNMRMIRKGNKNPSILGEAQPYREGRILGFVMKHKL